MQASGLLWALSLAVALSAQETDLPIVLQGSIDRDTATVQVGESELRARLHELPVGGAGPLVVRAEAHLFDVVLVVYDADGNVVAQDDDGWILRSAQCVLTAEQAARATRVAVCGKDDYPGAYELTIAPGAPDAPSPADVVAYRRRNLAERLAVLGSDDPDTIGARTVLAQELFVVGRDEEAFEELEQAITDAEPFGPGHPVALEANATLVVSLLRRKLEDRAEPWIQRLLRDTAQPFEADIGDARSAWENAADMVRIAGQTLPPTDERSRTLMARAIAIFERHVGDCAGLGRALNMHGWSLQRVGRYEEARARFVEAIRVLRETLGPADPVTLTSTNNLAYALMRLGRDDEAEPILRSAAQAVSDLDSAEAKLRSTAALVQMNLGAVLYRREAFREARGAFARAIDLYESVGAGQKVAQVLINVSELDRKLGELASAREHLDRALALLTEAGLDDGYLYGVALSNLAYLQQAHFDYGSASRSYEKAIEILSRHLPPHHDDLLTARSTYSSLLQDQGKVWEALPLVEAVYEQRRATLRPDDPRIASSMLALAFVRRSVGDRDGALTELRGALEREVQAGRDATERSIFLRSEVGELARSLGSHEEAEEFLDEALRLAEARLPSGHPTRDQALYRRALLHAETGDLDAAIASIASIVRRDDSDSNAGFVELETLARLQWAAGSRDDAWDSILESVARRQRWLRRAFLSSTESECLLYAAKMRQNLWMMAVLARARGDAPSLERAFEAYCGWQGVVARTSSQQRQRVLRTASGETLERVDRLRALQSQIEAEVSVADEAVLGRLRRERESLERELLGEVTGERGRTDVASLARSLPDSSALVLFTGVGVRDPMPRAADGSVDVDAPVADERLHAWVLRSSSVGERLLVFDLGSFDEIMGVVREHLVALGARAATRGDRVGDRVEGDPVSDRLANVLWEPLHDAIGDVGTVFVIGDADLARLPFETIRRSTGRYLVEDHGFVYLDSAADLIRAVSAGDVAAPSGSWLVVGDVDYGAGRQGEQSWSALPGSRQEIVRLEALAREAGRSEELVVLRGTEATEEAIRAALPDAELVHVASHGFFDESGGQAGTREASLVTRYSPGYLNGLVCAGANAGRSQGRLTAEEIGWFDLGGCRLAVLSACETGVGVTRSGEGALSLRRYFLAAGARSVVATMWRIDDRATVELMNDLYRRLLLEGSGVLDALRGAQLACIERDRAESGATDPAVWGAFVLSGDWR
jgi:CHAT domain-containing protein/tetratricopeptide (TPR) repeat protein